MRRMESRSGPAHTRSHASERHGKVSNIVLAAYVGLIVYGSLFPFNDWTTGMHGFSGIVLPAWPDHLEKADIVQNLLLYLPLGWLMTSRLRIAPAFVPPFAVALSMAVVLGTLLSTAIEIIQQFNPSRVSSAADILLNCLGALLGGVLTPIADPGHALPQGASRVRHRWFLGGGLANAGLIVVGMWILSQTAPFVPSLDMGQLRQGLKPLIAALLQPETIELAKTASYACNIAGLGMLVATLRRPGKPTLAAFAILVAVVLASKAFIAGRSLSAEAFLGALAAMPALAVAWGLPGRTAARAGFVLIAAGFVIHEAQPLPDGALYPFNWMPFVDQFSSMDGIADSLDWLWPLMALACFIRYLTDPARHAGMALAGGWLVLLALAVLEWHQLALPGRHGDISQIILGCLGWTAGWCVQGSPDERGARNPTLQRTARRHCRDKERS